jgi:hypothetical protein
MPIIDTGVVAFGIFAIVFGSRIVGDFTIPLFLPLWAGMIIFGAFAGLVGLIFLRSRLELLGIGAASLGLTVYAGLTILYIMAGSITSILTLVLIIIRIAFYLWRFFDLLGQLQREEAGKAVSTGEIPTERGKHRE